MVSCTHSCLHATATSWRAQHTHTRVARHHTARPPGQGRTRRQRGVWRHNVLRSGGLAAVVGGHLAHSSVGVAGTHCVSAAPDARLQQCSCYMPACMHYARACACKAANGAAGGGSVSAPGAWSACTRQQFCLHAVHLWLQPLLLRNVGQQRCHLLLHARRARHKVLSQGGCR